MTLDHVDVHADVIAGRPLLDRHRPHRIDMAGGARGCGGVLDASLRSASGLSALKGMDGSSLLSLQLTWFLPVVRHHVGVVNDLAKSPTSERKAALRDGDVNEHKWDRQRSQLPAGV